jgi:transcriptional regulator with GAF, ATPase, and Fis domain/tetratricopeptide (TPR) repeat protein
MISDNLELSSEQWHFLAVLNLLGGSSTIEIIGDLVPLKPGPLINLLKKGKENRLIQQKEDNRLILNKSLPGDIQEKIRQTINLDFITHLIEKIQATQLQSQIEPKVMIRLLGKLGRVKEAAEIEFELVYQAQKQKKYKKVKIHLRNIVDKLFESSGKRDIGSLFIAAALHYSNICFLLGQELDTIEKYLHRAEEVAQKIGDTRSHGLVTLHFGRLYYFRDRRDEALVKLSNGFNEIRKLGDDDIVAQSSGFLGIYFFTQGLYHQALEYLEKAEDLYQQNDDYLPVSPLAPLFLGFCATYLGRFHLAVGTLDYYGQLARERSDDTLATTMRAELGTVLMVMGNTKEALFHLEHSCQEAIASKNLTALYLNGGGLALHHFHEGRTEKAYEVIKETYQHGTRLGLVRQFSSPWILEMLYEFHRLGFKPILQMDYPELQADILNGVNVHLKGVALRLHAKELFSTDCEEKQILDILTESERYLEKSGDQIQRAKTILEMARVHLSFRNRKRAQQLARKAWELLGGSAERYFPDEFRILLEESETAISLEKSQESFLKRYFEMWEELFPVQETEKMLDRIVRSTNRLFGAERGGLFWFSGSRLTQSPELMAACNLSPHQVEAPDFKPNLQLIRDSYRQNEPLVVRQKQTIDSPSLTKVHSILCIPIEIRGDIQGILYYENSYLKDAFDFLNTTTIRQIAHHHSMIIERLSGYLAAKEQIDNEPNQKSFSPNFSVPGVLIGKSTKIKELLKQADKVAQSDSTVLILGESGTGKELLAERIRYKSRRSDKPLVIVDVTTIPENLFESELFGHEKGSFTGADKRKIGYIELAHSGTMLLDEVGELPLQIQTKLLRSMQEKTFSRVGGTQRLTSDFRLIVATNRNLAEDVVAGRFREDLYYRLNVIPLTIPPLRVRGMDILHLTKHFIEGFSKKHGLSDLRLTREDEKTILQYKWPGNVRELQNVIERAVILSNGQHLELNLKNQPLLSPVDLISDKPSLEEIQRRYIRFVLENTNGKVSGPEGAASILGMKRTSLYSRMKTLGMKKNI